MSKPSSRWHAATLPKPEPACPSDPPAGAQVPAYQKTGPNTVLAWADELPFRSNSMDYIISTHNLGAVAEGRLLWGRTVGRQRDGSWSQQGGERSLEADSSCVEAVRGLISWLPTWPPMANIRVAAFPHGMPPGALSAAEHLNDPVAAVLHYLDIVKPGGGVGIVVPNWEYAWDARGDDNEWGHR